MEIVWSLYKIYRYIMESTTNYPCYVQKNKNNKNIDLVTKLIYS